MPPACCVRRRCCSRRSVTTTVRGGDGALRIQDGPFADTKEQLGGTFVIEVDDLDAAIGWAGEAPVGRAGAPSRSVPSAPGSSTAPGRRSTTHDRCAARGCVGARAAAERAARASYGRILAVIAAATRDVALAEDALADAFEKALRTWPDAGIPDNPEGWLVTVARNRLRDLLRSPAVRDAAPLLESVLDADDRDAAAIVAGRERDPRQAARAAVRLRAPGDRSRHPHAAHAADGARLRRGADRPRVRRRAGDDGAAARPGEAADPRCRHPVRRPDPRSTCRRG